MALWPLLFLLALTSADEDDSSHQLLQLGGADDLCAHCECSGFRIVCSALEGRDADFVDVSASVTVLEVSGAGRIGFRKGSLRAGARRTQVTVRGCRGLRLDSKSITLLERGSRVFLEASEVDRVEVETGAVDAEAGEFRLRLESVGDVSVSGQSFDVLRALTVSGAASLRADPSAFKPRVILGPDLEVELAGVRSIPTLPAGAFTSSGSIRVRDSAVKEIAANAFSGNQIGNVEFNNVTVDRVHRQEKHHGRPFFIESQ